MDNLIRKHIPAPLEGQSGVHSPGSGFNSLFSTFITMNDKTPAWWSDERDKYLRREVFANPFLDSIVSTIVWKLYSLPFRVITKDSSIGVHQKLADTYSEIMRHSFMEDNTLEKFIRSFLTQDNGAFLYVDGMDPSNSPLTSLPTGLTCLDSTLVQRTGDYEFPYIYWHPYNSNAYAIHRSRMISLTQSPSTDVNMFGVGYSFVSRAMVLAQHIYDIAIYEGEVLGSRSSEEIVYASGARSEDLKKAFDEADIASHNEGLTRYAKRVFIGMRDPSGKLGKLNLKNLPEQFDKRNDIEVTLTLIALASGGSPNWFYDSVKSGSTKASASESSKIGESKLENWYIKNFCDQLALKFLPDSLDVLGGHFDEDSTGVRARIKLNLAQTRKINIESSVTDIRTERELQLHRGELTRVQFENLELTSGRTPDGLPIRAVFQTEESILGGLVRFIDDPLDLDNVTYDKYRELEKAIYHAESVALNSRTFNMRRNGRVAMSALEWLRKEYAAVLELEVTDLTEDGIIEDESDTASQEPPVLNGVNSDEIIDNEEDAGISNPFVKSNIEVKFTTSETRSYSSEYHKLARSFWNAEINKDTFKNEYESLLLNTLSGISNDKSFEGLVIDTAISDIARVANFIQDNQRSNNGKLYSIYEEIDKWYYYYESLRSE